MTQITLAYDDPTVFAQCPECCKKGKGVKFGQVFQRAFTPARWKRHPKCENCKTPLVFLYEVKRPERVAKPTTATRPVKRVMTGGRIGL